MLLSLVNMVPPVFAMGYVPVYPYDCTLLTLSQGGAASAIVIQKL